MRKEQENIKTESKTEILERKLHTQRNTYLYYFFSPSSGSHSQTKPFKNDDLIFLGSYSMLFFFLKDSQKCMERKNRGACGMEYKHQKGEEKNTADEVITKATHEKRYENKTFLCVLFNDDELEHTI